jgi:hypothetical protein
MAARKTSRAMALFEAHQIIKGACPPGKTRALRDKSRSTAMSSFNSGYFFDLSNADWKIDSRPSSAQWETIANHDAGMASWRLLAPPEVKQTIDWIASAPEQYAGLAIYAGIWRVREHETHLLLEKLLGGDAGPYARAAAPEARFSFGTSIPALQHALLQLPQQELEAITAPHAGDWPCYADRMIASSATWTHRKYEDLFKSLCRIAPNHAAECAVWNPVRHVFCATPIQLLARLPPSPQMLEIVERFGKPEVVRELLAAQVGRQLSTEMPRQDDDALPQAEMI